MISSTALPAKTAHQNHSSTAHPARLKSSLSSCRLPEQWADFVILIVLASFCVPEKMLRDSGKLDHDLYLLISLLSWGLSATMNNLLKKDDKHLIMIFQGE
jgi:uncharacterized membrane protein YadS